jgi:biopolymer transport protein ExbB/TolQ
VNKFNRLLSSITLSPLLWGVAAAVLFYMPIHSGQWDNPFVRRYFAGHWVEYVSTTLFFVGVAAVVLRMLATQAQRPLLDRPLLDAIPPGGQPVTACDVLLARLEALSGAVQDTYLVRRLREALEYVYRKGSADALDDELRSLADMDVARMHAGYSFARIVIWAIPILGFLGTVIGITEAVAGLSPQALEDSLPSVTAGLGVAFDTTTLSLALSMVLMFCLHTAERFESQLVSDVDSRVAAEMVGRFQPSINAASDPQVAVIRRIAEEVVRSSDNIVARQAELWQTTFTQMQQQWQSWSQTAAAQLETSLAKTMQDHAKTVAASADGSSSKMLDKWSQVQQALLQSAEAVTLQQRELVKQGEVLSQVVSATGQVEKLESELNRNLNTLAGAKNFEQTVLSLGAAIQLLNAKLGALPSADTPSVDLKKRTKAA